MNASMSTETTIFQRTCFVLDTRVDELTHVLEILVINKFNYITQNFILLHYIFFCSEILCPAIGFVTILLKARY